MSRLLSTEPTRLISTSMLRSLRSAWIASTISTICLDNGTCKAAGQKPVAVLQLLSCSCKKLQRLAGNTATHVAKRGIQQATDHISEPLSKVLCHVTQQQRQWNQSNEVLRRVKGTLIRWILPWLLPHMSFTCCCS